MGRPSYVCTTCSEHFTRKYSAKRHNISVHKGGGEIVPLVEYLVGRSFGKYQASHPFWYRRNGKRIHKFGRPTVADYVGDIFPYRGLQQQTPSQPTTLSPHSVSQPQPQPSDVSPDPTGQQFQTIDTTNGHGAISQETILKIQEFKRLMYKYSQYHLNPDGFIKCVTYLSINGDNTLLDEKLEQLRSIDAISKGT
jgi:hypothetical protein